MVDLEGRLLADLAELQHIADSAEYTATRGLQHSQIIGVVKSLLAAGLVEGEVCSYRLLMYLWYRHVSLVRVSTAGSAVSFSSPAGATPCQLCLNSGRHYLPAIWFT